MQCNFTGFLCVFYTCVNDRSSPNNIFTRWFHNEQCYSKSLFYLSSLLYAQCYSLELHKVTLFRLLLFHHENVIYIFISNNTTDPYSYFWCNPWNFTTCYIIFITAALNIREKLNFRSFYPKHERNPKFRILSGRKGLIWLTKRFDTIYISPISGFIQNNILYRGNWGNLWELIPYQDTEQDKRK